MNAPRSFLLAQIKEDELFVSLQLAINSQERYQLFVSNHNSPDLQKYFLQELILYKKFRKHENKRPDMSAPRSRCLISCIIKSMDPQTV